MNTKHTSECLAKAADDEPIFVLRAQDESSPSIIQTWIATNPQLSLEKKTQAQTVMHQMREWKNKRAAD